MDWVVVLIGAMQAPVQYRRSLNRLVPSFHLSTGISKRLDPGSSKLARDDTVYSLMVLVSGEPFHHFTFPPFHLKNTFPPIVAPIYYEGVGLICITLSGVGLPGVNLIIYKDDLRMMAPKPVAAKEGAMKEKRDSKRYMLTDASIKQSLKD